MTDFGSVLNVALSVGIVVSIAVAAFVRSNQSALRDQVNDQAGQISNLRGNRDDIKASLVERDRELIQVRQDLKTITNTRMGAEEWARILGVLRDHHREAEEHWENEESFQARVLAELMRIKEAAK